MFRFVRYSVCASALAFALYAILALPTILFGG